MLDRFWAVEYAGSQYVAGENKVYFYMGGLKHDCIIIDKRSDMLNVGYHPSCTVDGKMPRGDGTKKMIRCALMVYMSMYNKRKIYFKDTSTIDCGGTRSSLALINITLYGKTWYERHFGAIPENAYDASILDKPLTMGYNDFVRKYGVVNIAAREHFKKGMTVRQLAKEVWAEEKDCSTLMKWLPNYAAKEGFGIEENTFHMKRDLVEDSIGKPEVEELEGSPYTARYWAKRKEAANKKMNDYLLGPPPRKGGVARGKYQLVFPRGWLAKALKD